MHVQENQFLLGLGVTCTVLAGTAVALMFVMRRSFEQEQQQQDQVGRNLPAHLTADRTPQQKIKDCYLNRGGPALQEVLKYTRPGTQCVQLPAFADQRSSMSRSAPRQAWCVT